MNTALYCTSTAPTDTYYTHTNLGKAGELRPSLRPRSAAGRRPSKVKDLSLIHISEPTRPY